jgi:hypothetical protein
MDGPLALHAQRLNVGQSTEVLFYFRGHE